MSVPRPSFRSPATCDTYLAGSGPEDAGAAGASTPPAVPATSARRCR